MRRDAESRPLCRRCTIAVDERDQCNICEKYSCAECRCACFAQSKLRSSEVEVMSAWDFASQARAHEREKIAEWLEKEGFPALAARVRLKEHILLAPRKRFGYSR